MDKMMDSPWFLRITALLLAFLLFFSVQGENNDNNNSADTGTIDEVIEDVGLEVFYDNTNLVVSGVPETVDLHISGPPSRVQTTRQLQDFSLFVDLRDLPLGEHRVQVQTENLSEQLTARVNPAFLNVTIEERITQEFRIDPEMNERLVAEGFVIDSMTANPETVSITGAQSVIDAISFVKASVSREEEVSESFTTEARVRVLANDLSKLDNVVIVPEAVEVEVEIEEYSQEVPVSLEQTGTPQAGVTIDSLKVSNDTVRVYGPRNAVDQLEELTVEVDTGAISPTDTVMEIELEAPAGTRSVAPGEVTVEAGITVDETARLSEEAPLIPAPVSDAAPDD
ncbi:YbbR-like domain-containing protein [Planococcus salinus]|uniref:YbbR-like domain-containing protein n=1 Tax=Planococcus salinus TaxID=1848460 RepID=A0A3M8P684_9BACL|nr:CdaR family protein [Planococcus salinus]RNF38790.1 hypothetical protein EEX84_13270 [Planococcus salinus]